MIEYKMIGEDNRYVTLDNINEVIKSIEDIFPKTDESEKRGLRETFGRNGESFHVYCGYKGPRIFMPKKYEESIKERLEVIAGLKFESIKCQ